MGKLINMATGGLMSKPPYLNTKEEKIKMINREVIPYIS